MSFFSYGKNFKGVADVFLRSPDTYRSLLGFLQVVMVGESDLTKVEREVLAARVSMLNGCDFCVQAHLATLAAMELPGTELDALQDNVCARFGDSGFQSLLDFAERLTLAPATIGQQQIDVLCQAGVSEQTIEDAINVIALFNYVNRLVDAFGVEGSPEYFATVGKSLARNGYARLLPAEVH